MQPVRACADRPRRSAVPVAWVFACALALAALPSRAQDEAPPVHADIPQSAVKGGGGRSAGGLFEAMGTIAVNDADPSIASAAAFTVEGGFFIVENSGGSAAEHIFKDSYE